MVSIVTLERDFENRVLLEDKIESIISGSIFPITLKEQISVKSSSLNELGFVNEIDILFIGKSYEGISNAELHDLVNLYPNTLVLASVENITPKILDKYYGCGVADVFSGCPSSEKLLSYCYKAINLVKKSSNQGRLVLVDSGKGGVGVTSSSVMFSQAIASRVDGRVCLVDLDIDSADLTRFLTVKPAFNDELESILTSDSVLNAELIEKSVSKIWDDSEVYIATPASSLEKIIVGDKNLERRFLKYLECLNKCYEFVVIDTGSARGDFLKSLYQVSDKVVYLVSNDPSAIHACLFKVKNILNNARRKIDVVFQEVACSSVKLNSKHFRANFINLPNLEDPKWFSVVVPFSKKYSTWTGSSYGVFDLISNKIQMKLDPILDNIIGSKSSIKNRKSFSLIHTLKNILINKNKKLKETKTPESYLGLPEVDTLTNSISKSQKLKKDTARNQDIALVENELVTSAAKLTNGRVVSLEFATNVDKIIQ